MLKIASFWESARLSRLCRRGNAARGRGADGAAAPGAYIAFSHPDGAAVQIVELLILAALAAVVLFQLYAVLGRRVGRGPEDLAPVAAPPAPEGVRASLPSPAETAIGGLAAVRVRDPNFDVAKFLDGARGAYELIVKAFHAGDRAALQPLLSPPVLAAFEGPMAEREAAGRQETIEFPHPPRADLEGLSIVGESIRAAVRFLAELRRREQDAAGERTQETRTAEVWTFERLIASANPNWTLIHVDAAEA